MGLKKRAATLHCDSCKISTKIQDSDIRTVVNIKKGEIVETNSINGKKYWLKPTKNMTSTYLKCPFCNVDTTLKRYCNPHPPFNNDDEWEVVREEALSEDYNSEKNLKADKAVSEKSYDIEAIGFKFLKALVGIMVILLIMQVVTSFIVLFS